MGETKNEYHTLNVTNVAPMFPSTARNQYKKNFLRSSVVACNTGTDKFLLKERMAAG